MKKLLYNILYKILTELDLVPVFSHPWSIKATGDYELKLDAYKHKSRLICEFSDGRKKYAWFKIEDLKLLLEAEKTKLEGEKGIIDVSSPNTEALIELNGSDCSCSLTVNKMSLFGAINNCLTLVGVEYQRAVDF